MRSRGDGAWPLGPEQIVGCRIKTKFELRDGKPVLVRLSELNFIDDGAGKPVGIHSIALIDARTEMPWRSKSDMLSFFSDP